MSPLAAPLVHRSFSLKFCHLLSPPSSQLSLLLQVTKDPHLVCPACPVNALCPLSHRVPVTPLLVFFCLFGGHLPFSCPCSVVMPDHGAPGSLLSTLPPEVSSLPRVSRFPGPAQISLLNARSLEANADFLSVADAGHDARHRRSIIRSSSSPSHILLLLCYHLSKWLPPVS